MTRFLSSLPSSPLGALLLGTLAVALWSGSTVAEKMLLDWIPPLPLLAWQLGVSVLVLWAAVLAGRLPLPRRGEWLRVAWPGLLQPGLANLLLLLGLSLSSATTFALLNSCEGLLGVLFAWALLGERAGRATLGFAGLATLGVGLVVFSPSPGVATTLPGLLLVAAGTVFASLYAVACTTSAPAAKVPPLVLTTLHQSLGLGVVLVALAVARPAPLAAPLSAIDPAVWLWAALAGLLQYALPFWLLLVALQRLSVSTMSLLFTLGPVFVLVGAVPTLGEWPAPLQWLGTALTLASLAAVALWPARRRQLAAG